MYPARLGLASACCEDRHRAPKSRTAPVAKIIIVAALLVSSTRVRRRKLFAGVRQSRQNRRGRGNAQTGLQCPGCRPLGQRARQRRSLGLGSPQAKIHRPGRSSLSKLRDCGVTHELATARPRFSRLRAQPRRQSVRQGSASSLLPSTKFLQKKPFHTFFEGEQFSLVKGTPSSFSKTSGVLRTFCSVCGTSISYLDEGISNELYVALGFLDRPENFRPEAHAYWREKLPWIEFADRLPRTEGYSRQRDSAFGTPNRRT